MVPTPCDTFKQKAGSEILGPNAKRDFQIKRQVVIFLVSMPCDIFNKKAGSSGLNAMGLSNKKEGSKILGPNAMLALSNKKAGNEKCLISWPRGLHGELQRQREDAERKNAEQQARGNNIPGRVGQQQQVGQRQDADDRTETAELRDLHNLAGLLGGNAEEDGADGPGEDDQGAAEAGQLVAVAHAAHDLLHLRGEAGDERHAAAQEQEDDHEGLVGEDLFQRVDVVHSER